MKTTKFTATLWVNAGYGHNNEQKQSAKEIVSKVRQEAAKKIFEATWVYISASIKDANAVYHTDRGCPEWGEKIAEVNGTRNPEFMKDVEKYKQAVLDVLSLCQEELDQTTAQVEFSDDVEFVYLKREKKQ